MPRAAFALLLCSLLAASEQELSITWLGNTHGIGAVPSPQMGKWVQGDMTGACVLPDGTVATVAIWDEFGRCGGLYRDGNVVGNLGRLSRSGGGYAVASDGQLVYTGEVPGETAGGVLCAFQLSGMRHPTLRYQAGGRVVGLAARDGVLAASVPSAGAVRCFNAVKGGAPDRELQLDNPGALALLPGGDLLVVTGIGRGRYDDNYWLALPDRQPAIVRLDKAGKEVWRIAPRPGWLPASLALDAEGRLLVADAGRSQQVLFFDISGAPKLVERFGVEGGIGAGRPGEATADKFWGLQHAGCDQAGNLYVVMSEDGSVIRSFDAKRTLRWEVHSLFFVDNADVDPESDGRIVYGVNEKLHVDPATGAWKLAAITADHAGRDDPRRWRGNSAWASTSMRRIEGHLLQYTSGMYGQQSVFGLPGRADGELAVFDRSFADIGGAADIDAAGTWWRVQDNEVAVMELRCLSPVGRTAYEPWRRLGVLAGLGGIRVVAYDASSDTLVALGSADGKPAIAAFGEARSGKLVPRWTITDVLGDVPVNQDKKDVPCTLAADHGLVFVGGVNTRSRIWVRDGATGKLIRDFTPEQAAGGTDMGGINGTGWLDIPRAVRPFRRANGEWLILVEDDLSMRVLVYRWRPAGVKPEGLRVVTSSLPRPIRGKAYGPLRLTSEGAAEVHWSLVGTVPPGLKLSADGTLAGTPTAEASGDYTVTLTAAAGAQSASRTLSLRVAPHAALIAPATAAAAGVVDYPLSCTIAASGGTGWVAWSGKLPAGLVLDTASDGRSARISGRPAASGSARVALHARDEDGQTAEVQLALSIAVPPPVGAQAVGMPFGSALCWNPQSSFNQAFDGNSATFFDCTQSPGAECGLAFAEAKPLAQVRLFPRKRFLTRLMNVQVEVLPAGSDEWVVLQRFTEVPPDGAEDWITVPVTDPRPMAKARLHLPVQGKLNIAEFAVFLTR